MNKLAAQVDASQKIVALFTDHLDDYTTGNRAAAELLASLGTENWDAFAESNLTILQLNIGKAAWTSTEAQRTAGRAFNEAHYALQTARFAN